LEGNTVEITEANFAGLFQLSEEFNFAELQVKLSEFQSQLNARESQRLFPTLRLPSLRGAFFDDSFSFVVNGVVIVSDILETAALSPAVREQLSVDACAREFVLTDPQIEAADIHSLQCLFSGKAIPIRRSLSLLSRLLENSGLEKLFLGCSKTGIQATLSDWVKGIRIELQSTDLSRLSIDLLDSLLLSESVSVGSEDELLRFILNLSPDYWTLLKHIQIGFLSENGLSILAEHFEILPESVWQLTAELITRSFPYFSISNVLDSRIISVLPEIFAEFQTS
jgi:hypothetical protein